LVLFEMATHEGQLRTKLARPASGHAAADSKCLGFVGCGEHDSTANGNGFAAQRRIKQLLDRCIKGIEVRVKDGGCGFHPDVSMRIDRTWSLKLNSLKP